MNELKSKMDYGPWGQQFCPPFSYELAGKELALCFDAYTAEAVFLNEKRARWTKNETAAEAEYWALKLTNDVFMVSFGMEPETNITLIIDLAERLVTLDETGFDEKKAPVKRALDFGAIAMPGMPLPKKRHERTKELAGNCFKWVFCDTYWHAEGYYEDTMFYYSNYPDFKGEGPYTAVKISDTLYYSCNGDSVESICVLMDMKRLVSVSRSLVYGRNGQAIPLGAIGAFEDNSAQYINDL